MAFGEKRGLSKLILVGLIWLGFWLSLHHIDRFSFWIDEALTPIRAGYSIRDILSGVIYVQGYPTQDTQPPLYFLIIRLTKSLFGRSDFAYRFPSALFGILAIPLIFQFGRRIGKSNAVGLLAALWVAINPLIVWYAQEARMYTLLNLFGIGLTLILWQASDEIIDSPNTDNRILNTGPPVIWRWLGLYLIIALVAGLTHLLTVFLIAGHGLIWAWLLWRHTGIGRWLVIIGIVALLAILPLLPLFVPRLFTPAESGFTFVSLQQMLSDAIGGYSMGVTAPDLPWLRTALWWGYLLIIGLALLQLIRLKRWSALSILLVSFLTPILLNFLASQIKPMYQGIRHIMLGGAAFWVLIAIVGAGGMEQGATITTRRPIKGGLIVTCLALIVPLVGSVGALWGLFTNPAVAKDDLRGMVHYVEENAGGGDVVVYNDVILMLVHDHYGQRNDLTVTSLPVYPHKVVPQTTVDLADFASGSERIWFIPSPPADDRDKDQVVGRWLQGETRLIDEKFFTGRATELKVEGFQTDIATEVASRSLLDPLATFEQAPDLMTLSIGEAGPSKIWLKSSWQGEAPPIGSEIVLTLEGPDGWEWVRQQQPFLTQSIDDSFDSSLAPLWSDAFPNQLLIGLDRPIGLTSGPYTLHIGFKSPNGQSLGEAQNVTRLNLENDQISIPLNQAAASDSVSFSNGISLSHIDIADDQVRPGHILPVHVVWQAETHIDPTTLQYDLQVFSPADQLVYERSAQPGANWIDQWSPQTAYRDHTEVIFPPAAEPGRYAFRWRLTESGNPLVGSTARFGVKREWVTLGGVEVEAWPFLETEPATDQLIEATFAGVGQLVGINRAQTGDQLVVEVVWRVEALPAQNYFSFLHVVDPATGEIVAQRDWIPVEGLRPTQGWRVGEYIIDTHTVSLANLPSGTFTIVTGLYDPGSFERPLVTQGDVEQPDRQMVLGEVVR